MSHVFCGIFHIKQSLVLIIKKGIPLYACFVCTNRFMGFRAWKLFHLGPFFATLVVKTGHGNYSFRFVFSLR